MSHIVYRRKLPSPPRVRHRKPRVEEMDDGMLFQPPPRREVTLPTLNWLKGDDHANPENPVAGIA